MLRRPAEAVAVTVRTRPELIEELGGRHALTRAVGAGEWQRVLRGTYVPRGIALDLDVRAQAAARLLPPHALIADRCLLWLLGVDVLPPGPPRLELVVPREAVVPRRAGVLARNAEVGAGDRITLGAAAVPCLRPTRAAVDLLRMLTMPEAVVVADAVQHAGVSDHAALAVELDRHTGLRGVRQARRALELSDARAESPPESRLRLGLVLDGLTPVPQHVVLDDRGTFVARVDLAFPAVRLAVEYDGREVHERSNVFVTDRRRHNALVAAGWTVLRFTAADLRDGGLRVVVQQIAAALHAAAA